MCISRRISRRIQAYFQAYPGVFPGVSRRIPGIFQRIPCVFQRIPCISRCSIRFVAGSNPTSHPRRALAAGYMRNWARLARRLARMHLHPPTYFTPLQSCVLRCMLSLCSPPACRDAHGRSRCCAGAPASCSCPPQLSTDGACVDKDYTRWADVGSIPFAPGPICNATWTIGVCSGNRELPLGQLILGISTIDLHSRGGQRW